MKQFKTILKFELLNYLKNKIFLGITIFCVIIVAAVMFFPRIYSAFKGNDSAKEENNASVSDTVMPDSSVEGETITFQEEGIPVMLVLADTKENTQMVWQAFTASFPDYKVMTADGDISYIKEQITSGEAECAFVMENLTSYTYYVNNLTMYDSNTVVADETLENLYRIESLSAEGISPEKTREIFSVVIDHETNSLGKDQIQNFFYTYIMIFALYMVILLYGQMVATNVATEKSSRAMELLITSAKPASMMFGKVIASCLAGFIQLTAIFGSTCLFYNINKPLWGDNPMISSIFNVPVNLLIFMLVFFVLGFFIYAFLFGAIGSTASKVEDINTSVMPLTFLFIIAFMVVVFSMSSGNIDNLVMKICSYIPFTSPMAMFTRIAMSTVAPYEIVISIAILIVSVFGIGILSAKIYRVGVLLYGTTPKISSILKAVKRA